MSRIVQRAVLAAGVAGALLACGAARADAPRTPSLACTGSSLGLDRPACRPGRIAHRRIFRAERPQVAAARLPLAEAALYGSAPVYSLLILGIGY